MPSPTPGEPLVQILVRPGGEARVDRGVEGHELLRDAAGRGDGHDHDDRRLEQQRFDVAHGGGLEPRGRDEREQLRHLAQHLGRRLQRRLHLALHRGQVEREAGRPRLLPFEQLLGVEAIAGSGRDPAGRRVRMREQPERLELRELAPHGRRGDGEARALDERLRADRLAGGHVLLDDPSEDVALAIADPAHLQVILAVVKRATLP